MIRRIALRLHRWAGLVLAGFLILVGATGAVMAFLPELNRALTPELYPPPREGPQLPLATLIRRAEAAAPQYSATQIIVIQPGAARVAMTPRREAIDAQPPSDFMFLDPVTGRVLGSLAKEPPLTTAAGIMPFVDRLHYKLAMGEWGEWLLGLVAFLWTLDTFTAAYLTFPASVKKTQTSWLSRWMTSWRIKIGGSGFRVVFDIHRAFGLWLFPMLLVFAWSGVYFNLREAYTPITRAFLDFDPPSKMSHAGGAHGASAAAPMSWEDAEKTGERLMAEQAKALGFIIDAPIRLALREAAGEYAYVVHSSLDLADKRGRTTVEFDAQTGDLRGFRLPTGQRAGNTFTTWIMEMHLANVFGMPFKIVVSSMGVVVTLLSGTGVIIWWRKKQPRKRASPSSGVAMGALPAAIDDARRYQ